MAKAKKDQEQGEQKTGEEQAVIETTPVAFPLSSVDSAFAAREAEAPISKIISSTPFEMTVDGQLVANVVPAAADSDARNVTLASVEKVIGSEVHGKPKLTEEFPFKPSDVPYGG